MEHISGCLGSAPLYLKSIVGFGIVIVGVSLYNWVKYKIMTTEKALESKDEVCAGVSTWLKPGLNP